MTFLQGSRLRDCGLRPRDLRSWDARRGAVAVEFALIVGILVMLVIGIADGSAAWRAQHIIQSAAREGARVATVTPNLEPGDPRVLAIVDDIVREGGIEDAAFERGVIFAGPLEPGDPVTVTVTHDFVPPVISSLVPQFDGPIGLTASSTMRYEFRSMAEGSSIPLEPPGPPQPEQPPEPRQPRRPREPEPPGPVFLEP